MKKRMLSLILAAVLIITGSFQVNFASESNDKLDQNIYLSINNNGSYTKSDKKSADVTASMTKDYGIYATKDGSLFSYTGTDTYLQVEKVEVSLVDVNAVEDLLTNYSVPIEIQENIRKTSNEAISNNNLDARVALVVPKLSQNTGEIGTRATYNNYYTYNGYNMLDTQIMYYSISTPTTNITSGSGTKATADLIKEFVFVGLGFAPPAIALVATGVSLIDFTLTAAQQSVFTGSTSDFIETYFTYDVSTKWTYIDKGNGWQLGCISQHVFLISSYIRQYYFNRSTGQNIISTPTYNKGFTSPNYLVPAPKAYMNYMNPWDERMQIKLNGVILTP